MLKQLKADLHIHSCLSPCADDQMVPRKIIDRAKMNGLDMVAICDHNSAENVMVTQEIGQKEDVTVFGGMEATSQEEIHILALFDNTERLFEFQAVIYENLSGLNNEKVFGRQVIVDQDGQIIGLNNRLLIGATSLSLQEIVETIRRMDGLAIASHVDRDSFSVISQLGFIPEGLRFDALELSPNYQCPSPKGHGSGSQRYGFPLVTFSDAHFLSDVGKKFTIFLMKEPSVEEMRKALWGQDGRKVMSW